MLLLKRRAKLMGREIDRSNSGVCRPVDFSPPAADASMRPDLARVAMPSGGTLTVPTGGGVTSLALACGNGAAHAR
jgi:hypothetical protein